MKKGAEKFPHLKNDITLHHARKPEKMMQISR